MNPRAIPAVIAAGLVLAAQGCSPPARTSPVTAAPSICAPGTRDVQLDAEGESRFFHLHVPPGYVPGSPTPLVLAFHGNTGYADGFERYSGLSTLADEMGFIAAYPQGFGDPPTWDTWQGSKDVEWIGRVVDRLAAECSLDLRRIYATGFSLGGGMANRLACDLADRIAAVGTISGAYQYADECSPTRAVSILAIHGTEDPVIAYGGIPTGMRETYFIIGVPIPQWASLWAQRDGCQAKAAEFFREAPFSGQAWPDCHDGAQVRLYTVDGGGHAWPAATRGFDADRVLWEFFQAHPLPQPEPAQSGQ